jgi:hypothetical protein
MDKKLVAAFTFGLLAVTAANLLLSVGIVSLLLTGGPGTDIQSTAADNTPAVWLTAKNAVSLADMNNTTTAANMGSADMPSANATQTLVVATEQQSGTMLPTGGQFQPPAGQMPPAGQWQGTAGQMPPAGQYPQGATAAGQTPQTAQATSGASQAASGGQLPSGTSQLPSGMGQYMSGTGSMPAGGMSTTTGTNSLPSGITSLINGQTGTASQATPTPKPTLSFFNNMTSMLADQLAGA